jgi:mono/diheme cytochrome c family protein
MNMNFKHISILVVFVFSGWAQLVAQETKWDIPKDASGKTAPFLFNDSIKTLGEAVYMLNCKSCHGEPGKGNYANLNPIPKDPASAEYQNHTDGDLFYILSTGRGLMPTFQSTLTENQRWEVISYVRSFNKDYVQPAVRLEETDEIKGRISLNLTYNESLKSVFATVNEKSDGKISPVKNALVKLYVKRTFGNLPIGQANSDENGIARIPFPTDIAGDSAGNINLVALAGNGSRQVSIDKTEKIGVPVQTVLLLEKNAMWNIRSKAPIWLVISYICGGIAVAGVVLYVLLQLKKIKNINQLNNTSHE